jgi:hypothetical protein
MNIASTHHALDRAIMLEPQGDGIYQGRTSADYANMIGPFGGATAATVMQALMLHPQRLGEVVALTLNYAGPVADGAFIIETRIVRTNRSTQHWTIELRQGSEVALTATAVSATRRDTWGGTELRFPGVVPPAAIAPMEPVEWAAWARNYDMRFMRGSPEGLPADGSGSKDSLSQLWIRDEPPRALDFASLTAICDAFFPRLFLRRPKMVPVGTVSLTIYFHADGNALAAQGTQPVLAVAQAQHFSQGYFDQSAQIWSKNGLPLATTHQVVYYKQ